MDIKRIAALAAEERFAVKKHAALRMRQRLVKVDDLRQALLAPKVIEIYEDDYPLPSCLVLGFAGGRPLHIVLAVSESDSILWIITVYEPNEEEWRQGFFERRIR